MHAFASTTLHLLNLSYGELPTHQHPFRRPGVETSARQAHIATALATLNRITCYRKRMGIYAFVGERLFTFIEYSSFLV